MIRLRKAEAEEAERILEFYQGVIDSIKDSEFRPKWNESYPNLEFIKTSIEKEEMHICTKDEEIISCVVLNSRFEPEYEDINWNVNAEPDEIIVIHTFAVSSASAGKGIGKEVFTQIKDNAIKDGRKTIRIDIITGNTGAQKVFEKFGFDYIESVRLFHPAVGLERFHLYEYSLNRK